MRNLRFTVAYDGTNYKGWQRQANATTVQEIVEQALTKLCKEPITVMGSGRTDAGVHAQGQVVSFRTTCRIPADRLGPALKSLLPPDIVARDGEEVAKEFHARYSAKGKIYRYVLYNNAIASPFYRQYTWHIENPLDFEAMRLAAADFIGRHDFSAFRSANRSLVDPVRTIYQSSWRINGDLLEYGVEGTGFLYHMVRNMVGTMVEIGAGKRPAQCIPDIIRGQDRTMAGTTAPAHGLYLERVYY
jgi:tRNA pseudouridine38-40 synthase